MAQYGFFFDSSRCTGCKTCELACKDYKDLSQTIAFRKVYDYEGGTWTANDDGTYTTDAFAYHVSLACNHCTTPACFAACPSGAIEKDADTGLVRIIAENCTGEKMCVDACPYDVPVFDDEAGVAVKCDGCYDRVLAGKLPICVEACPLRALDFGEIEDLRAKYGDVAGIAPMPSPDETNPNIVIKECAAAKEPGDATGEIVNEKEVDGTPAYDPETAA